MPRERSNAISLPRGTIALTSKEVQMLSQAQEEGMARSMQLLSGMTYEPWSLGLAGLETSVGIGMSAYSFGSSMSQPAQPSTVGSRMADSAAGGQADTGAAGVTALLHKAIMKAQEKISSNPWIERLAKVLNIGISAVMSWIKKMVLDMKLIKQLVPGFDAIMGAAKGVMQAMDAYSHHSVLTNLRQAGGQIGSGFPSEALTGFKDFVSVERARAGAHSAFTFAKTIATTLLTIFAPPVGSIVGFVASVVEAIESFVYLAFQAISFGRATEKMREMIEEKVLMDPNDFRTIVASAPLVGCVFFAAANYIGHFHLTSLMSADTMTLSSSAMLASVAKVGEVQKAACGYVSATGFDFTFRTEEEKLKHGWVNNMIKGYSSDAPKSGFLTEDASLLTRFKHKFMMNRHRIKSGARKLVG